MVRAAEDCGDMNEASFVLAISTSAGLIIIPGDAHDSTWEHVLRYYGDQLAGRCALLPAPHHGRDSDRDYEFLSVLRPRLTLMGCADSEHMGYAGWTSRDLPFITNNQAGNIRVDVAGRQLRVWVENKAYAEANVLMPMQNEHRLHYSGAY
jgi:beta-lactamase superfamily II metal-dependent hydrolase